jgi:hypothetical protein
VPTADEDEIEKNSFSDELDPVYQKLSKCDNKFVTGNMNAKLEKVVIYK